MTEKNSIPHGEVTPECPILHKKAGVGLNLNIFRGKAEFTGCNLLHTGEDCCHECLTTSETRTAIADLLHIEHEKHLDEIAPLNGVVI